MKKFFVGIDFSKRRMDVSIVEKDFPERVIAYKQFINVSQKALHIYFIDGCRVCPLDAQYKVKNKNSDL